jgi:putative addiction module component (TIGR02574 family)
MPDRDIIAEILRLPAAERLALSAAIWDSLTEKPDAVPVPDWQLELLAERLDEDERDSGPAQSWTAIRRRSSAKLLSAALCCACGSAS